MISKRQENTATYLGHEALSESDDFDQKHGITGGVGSDVTHHWEHFRVKRAVGVHLPDIPQQVLVSGQLPLQDLFRQACVTVIKATFL